MRPTRRTVLKTSGLTALLGSTVLAGCSSGFPGSNAGSSPRDWQYDPSVLSETSGVLFGTAAYERLYRNRQYFPEPLRRELESSLPAPLNPADVEAVAGVGAVNFGDYGTGSSLTFGSLAFLGSFEREAVERTVRTQGNPEKQREHRGFTLYEGVDGEEAGGLEGVPGGPTPFTMTAVGVGARAMVVGAVVVRGRNSGMVLADNVVETAIDTVTGDVPHLHENNRYADRLIEIVEAPTLVAGFQVDPGMSEVGQQSTTGTLGEVTSGLRAGGLGLTIEGSTSTVTLVGFYEDSTAAEATGAVASVEEIRERVVKRDDVASIDATYDGRAAVVTIDGDTRSLLAGKLVSVLQRAIRRGQPSPSHR